MIDHFFDDFFYVCKVQEASNCACCIQQAFEILGFKLDPKKCQMPQDIHCRGSRCFFALAKDASGRA